jgi:hypothetical protein
MSGPSIDPVTTLATAKTLADLLPPEGRMELMRHLMSRATPQCMARFMAEMPGMATQGAVAEPNPTEGDPTVGERILESWQIDASGIISFTVPAGVSDLVALRSLNRLFRKRYPDFARDALCSGDLDWYGRTAAVAQREVTKPRRVRVMPIVVGTRGLTREDQLKVLRGEGLRFAEPIEQALLAAVFACKWDGQDAFNDLWARGAVSGHALTVSKITGTRVCTSYDDGAYSNVAATGALNMDGERISPEAEAVMDPGAGV